LTTYNIVEATPDSKIGYQPFGAAADLWMCKAQEVIIAGPAETGKTRAALEKLDALMWKYPGAQSVILRKTYKSTVGSCIQTYENKVLTKDTPVLPYGGSKPEFYDYPNGSRIWVGGMDNPDKVLSSERDIIYVNQAEEFTLDEWETLTTRATGRAGNMPWSQVMGDCNPAHPKHWIKTRARDHVLTFLHSHHEDNPVLFDPDTGDITDQGQRTMAVLDALTGTRKERLRYGRWVQAEGVVYPQFDERVHIVDRFDIPDDWRRFRVIDFGLVHPFVCGWWAVDEDGRMYLYRELYMTGRTVATHAGDINRLSEGERIEATICDHDAEDRATLAENGVPNQPAKKDVLQGIGKVQDRLLKQADGRSRLYFLRDSLVEVDQTLRQQRSPIQTVDEFGGYIWNDRTLKEQPVKAEDDGMDMVRYGVMHLDNKKPFDWGFF
jgi:PBSX family phage terminase large subunit